MTGTGSRSRAALGVDDRDRTADGRDRTSDAPAGDRQHSGDDRKAASADRVHSAQERAALLLDGLTGAHRRDPGLLELERETTKAHRTRTSFVLAFIDVDGVKVLNDTKGHAAGDQLLRDVIDAIRGEVREYDLIVRYGGDEFLCGLLDVGVDDARRRFDTANATVGATLTARATVGLAALAPGESLEGLIARADAMMYEQRATRRSPEV